MKPPLINDLPEPQQSGACDFHAQPVSPRQPKVMPGSQPDMAMPTCVRCGERFYVALCPRCDKEDE